MSTIIRKSETDSFDELFQFGNTNNYNCLFSVYYSKYLLSPDFSTAFKWVAMKRNLPNEASDKFPLKTIWWYNVFFKLSVWTSWALRFFLYFFFVMAKSGMVKGSASYYQLYTLSLSSCDTLRICSRIRVEQFKIGERYEKKWNETGVFIEGTEVQRSLIGVIMFMLLPYIYAYKSG